jgi:hypothetical protein
MSPATDPPESAGPPADPPADPPAESAWQRRRRLTAVFGDVLPDTTADERDNEQSTTLADEEDLGDRWLRSQVPPHHG